MPGSFEALKNQQQQLLAQAQSVTYKKPKDGPELNIHFYLPKGLKEGPRCPVFLFFHSSIWDRGNIVQFAPQALYFVERGAVCGLVEYSTSSTHPESTPLDSALDALCAVRFVRHYQEQLHVDGSKVVVIGGGGGANLAASCALGIKVKQTEPEFGEHSSVPNAGVFLSALIDINRKSHAYRQFSSRPSEARKMSLTGMIDHSPPCPIIMIHGTNDRMTPISDAEAFAAKLRRRKKNQFEYHAFEGRDANFYNLNMDPVSFEAALNQIDKFLVDHLLLDMNENPNGASLISWREQDF